MADDPAPTDPPPADPPLADPPPAGAGPGRERVAAGLAGLARLDRGAGEIPALVPAATVVVLRDGADGLEVLMVRRSSSLAFAGGMWVFPGGRLDPDDHRRAGTTPPDPDADPDELLAAARHAAAREAAEEAGIAVDPTGLVPFSHWTPPARPGRRFSTWFFLTAASGADGGTVQVDGGEITEHRWVRPADAHRERDEGRIELTPPTWISLWALLDHGDVRGALAATAARHPERFATRIAIVGDEVHALYTGDVAYDLVADDETAATRPGPRHRLRMGAGPWVYERDR